ncbi:MAG: hypothetical protein M3Y87_09005 [Myxococcota bacterium]|nr:hypothetical protein [Myxococcota bacterium]
MKAPRTRPSARDRFEIQALVAMRHLQRLSIERWSRHTWVPLAHPKSASFEVISAHERHGSDLPEGLFVASRTPAEGRLGMLYVLPYYALARVAFELHQRVPIDGSIPWVAGAPWAPTFAGNGEGWGGGEDDDEFVRLRLQGPNPCLLRREDERTFALDLETPFAGTGRGVLARFERTTSGLRAGPITVDGVTIHPGAPRFGWAKRIVNALDARFSIFAQHLGVVHLALAQSFALAAAATPRGHPLHAILLAHTRGTLEVNDFAYRLLLSPASYFAQSGFFDRALATRLIGARVRELHLDDVIVPRDLAARGIDGIPDHAWAIEARASWDLFLDHARELVGRLYASDDALRADPVPRAFHAALRATLPRFPDDLSTMETREQLALLLAILLTLAPMHEVSGDYSPYALAEDLEQKRIVRWDALGEDDAIPSLRDVVLFEQGAYTGLSNASGNSMLDAPLARDPRLSHPFAHEWIAALRRRLVAHDAEVSRRNAARAHPLLRMQPRSWELSVSF